MAKKDDLETHTMRRDPPSPPPTFLPNAPVSRPLSNLYGDHPLFEAREEGRFQVKWRRSGIPSGPSTGNVPGDPMKLDEEMNKRFKTAWTPPGSKDASSSKRKPRSKKKKTSKSIQRNRRGPKVRHGSITRFLAPGGKKEPNSP